jgi:hypothetical protein
MLSHPDAGNLTTGDPEALELKRHLAKPSFAALVRRDYRAG